VDAENPTANQHSPRRSALRLVAVAAVVAVGGVAFSLLPHAKSNVPPVATIAPTLPPISPDPVIGLGFSVAADPAAHEVVLFGGLDSGDRTWLLDDQQWTLAKPRSSPPDRSGAIAAYDPTSRMVMLFGGTLAAGRGVNDTWAWNGTIWRRLDSGANGPPSGQGAQMAWDDATHAMVLVTEGESTNTAETWVWSGSHWTRAAHGDLDVNVFGDVMAYDPNSQTLLLVSPVMPDSENSIAQTWNGSSWQVVTRTGPDIEAMAYNALNDALFACGIATYSETVEVVSNCWEWTGASWLEEVVAVPAPDSKQMIIEAAVSDTDNSRLLMFGWLIRAIPGQPQPLDVFAWDGLEWLQLG
jgi:hypothetical protein